MKIYIDLVIFINFIFDFILLTSVNYILKRNIKLIKLIIGSLIGSITLIIMFISIPNILLLIFKFIISIIMLTITFGYKNIHYTLKNITYFYLVSMLLGGGIYFLNNQFSYSNNGLVFTYKGLGLSYIIILIISIFIFFKYLHSITLLKTNYNNYYKCKIYLKDNNLIEVNAFLDTGNHLIDPYTKKSIIIIDENLYDFSKYNPILVPYHTLNNEGLLTCYQGDYLEIEGRCCHSFLIGISNNNLLSDGINCIINNKIMEELK